MRQYPGIPVEYKVSSESENSTLPEELQSPFYFPELGLMPEHCGVEFKCNTEYLLKNENEGVPAVTARPNDLLHKARDVSKP